MVKKIQKTPSTQKVSPTLQVLLTLKYLTSRWYYILIVFAVWLGLLVIGFTGYLIAPSLLCLIFYAGICHDYVDYRRDSGPSRDLLQKLAMGFAALFLISEIAIYGAWGLMGILPLLYIWLMNRYTMLKSIALPVIFGYILMMSERSLPKIWLMLLVLLIINLLLMYWRQGKRQN